MKQKPENNRHKTINTYLSWVRSESGLSMFQFGQKLGIGATHVCYLEKNDVGRRLPSPDLINTIAREFRFADLAWMQLLLGREQTVGAACAAIEKEIARRVK